MRSLSGGVCRNCRENQICAYDVGKGSWSCRDLDYETDCPTVNCPVDCPVECISSGDCADCFNCVSNQCEYTCVAGEVCCDATCVSGSCCVDADCPEGQGCYDNVCSVSAASICTDINSTHIDNYVTNCRESGTCNQYYQYACSSVDLTGLTDLTFTRDFLSSSAPSNVFCCEDGENCSDGYAGCEPNCTACCNINDCSSNFSTGYIEHSYCLNGRLALVWVGVPSLYVGGSSYRRFNRSGFDFVNNSYTCAELKAARTINYSGGHCQAQSGKTDDDFPCAVSVIEFDYGPC